MRENLLFETDIFLLCFNYKLKPLVYFQQRKKSISAASTAIIITHTGTKKFGARKNQCLSYRYWALRWGAPGQDIAVPARLFSQQVSPPAAPPPLVPVHPLPRPFVVAGKAGRGGRARVGHTECAVYGNSVVVVFIQPIKPLSLGWTIEERSREVRKDV